MEAHTGSHHDRHITVSNVKVMARFKVSVKVKCRWTNVGAFLPVSGLVVGQLSCNRETVVVTLMSAVHNVQITTVAWCQRAGDSWT